MRGGVLGGSLGGCSPFSPCGCALLPLCGVRWWVGVSWCGLCGVGSVLRRRALVGVRFRGSRGVSWGWGGAGPSVVACPSCVCALVPVVALSPSVPRPLVLPRPGPLVVSCPLVAPPPVPCPCGCLLVTFGPSSPPCRGVLSRPLLFPFPCPFPSRCGGGGVGGGPAGRRWPMPGGGSSGATGGGFWGCRGSGDPERRPGRGLPMPPEA